MSNTAAPSAKASIFSTFKVPANRLDWVVLGLMGAKWAYGYYRDKRGSNSDMVVRFSSDDVPFYWLMRWLEKMPKQKELNCFKVMVPQCEVPNDFGGASPVLVPTDGVCFQFRGVKCWIEKVSAEGPNDMARLIRPEVQVRLRTRDVSVCEALLIDIEKAAKIKDIPKVYVHQKWGWLPVRKVPEGRTAILPYGELQALIDDVRAFRGAERWYQMTGLPYRRGYLLEGISGSGKTSAVIAIAAEFGMNVCVLGLSGYNDESLAEAVRNLPHNSILLLEDIDCAWEKREAKESVTFSGLLNVLDGAATPDGRLTFQTTNHRDRLDPALIRPGRVDYELNFTFACADQIEEMALRFSPTAKNAGRRKWANEKISMAQVQERLVKYYRPKTSA